MILIEVHHSEVVVPEARQRQTFDENYILELQESLMEQGQINPIVLRDGRTLVAGECRLRAVRLAEIFGKSISYQGRKLPPGHLLAVDWGQLSKLQQLELEYAENARRKDLTWQENLEALAQLKRLREAQAEQRGEVISYRDVAKEISAAQGPVAVTRTGEALLLAERLSDPDIAKAKSLKEATKIAKRKDEAVRRERLAAVVGTQSVSDRFQVYNEDCLAWMRNQPGGQFDVILTDPPYGMNADQFGDAAGKMTGINHEYSDSADHFKNLLSVCIPEWFRLAKPEAHLYLWCDLEHFLWLREQCQAAGWWTFRTPLVNLKPEGGRVPWPEHGPRRSYEICLYAVKGKKPVTSIRPDYFESRLREGNFGHGAQKPVEAYVELLKRSVRPGDRVLDTFAGTGTIFEAANEVRCSAVGVELEAAAYGICLERIGGLE